jgi:hypothetical protein
MRYALLRSVVLRMALRKSSRCPRMEVLEKWRAMVDEDGQYSFAAALWRRTLSHP